jgi:hypothetical protein
MFRTTPEAPEAAMSTTITDQIREYRHHAAAQRRMVTARNRRHLAAGEKSTGEAMWTERSLQVTEAHQRARTDISIALQEADQRELASALAAEAQALSQLAWSKLKGKDNVGLLTYTVTVARRTIRQATATPAAKAVADFRRHAAAVRQLRRRGSKSTRSLTALAEHSIACHHYAAGLPTDVAFALATEHNLLSRAARYRASEGGRESLRHELALVRRVVKRAVR